MVFVGPFEHHSNLLPWREAGAVVVRISETSDGLVNLVHLTKELQVCVLFDFRYRFYPTVSKRCCHILNQWYLIRTVLRNLMLTNILFEHWAQKLK